MKPETKFYNEIRDYKSKSPGPWWHCTRLESSTVPGIPDCNIVSYRFGSSSSEIISQEFWAELKSQNTDQPRVRPAQFAWLLKRATFGCSHCWLINQHPETKKISLWKFHEKIYAQRKSSDRIAILDYPTFTFNSVSEMIGTDPTRFAVSK